MPVLILFAMRAVVDIIRRRESDRFKFRMLILGFAICGMCFLILPAESFHATEETDTPNTTVEDIRSLKEIQGESTDWNLPKDVPRPEARAQQPPAVIQGSTDDETGVVLVFDTIIKTEPTDEGSRVVNGESLPDERDVSSPVYSSQGLRGSAEQDTLPSTV